MKKIEVLNHGWVGLVASMGNDLSISRSARVSHDAPPREEDTKLINYLMENRHNTPFESVTFTFDIKAPIFVLRQWHRHRTQSYNELSARYRELPEEYYLPLPGMVGTQSPKNKQIRDLANGLSDEEKEQAEQSVLMMDEQCRSAFVTYKQLLERGVPRELARGVLPFFTYSHMFATMNLHNLFHFLGLRMHSHAQYEIRVYADAMFKLIEPIVPIAAAAFLERLEK